MEARRGNGNALSTPRASGKGLATWRIVRYADDFVILVHGQRSDVEALREDVVQALAPLGLRLSPAKTRIVHMSDGFDFLGFHIQWRRKRGTNQWYVYTFIADRPVKAVKAKIRALTHRTSQANMGTTLTRINQILRGWVNYFRHAVCSHTLDHVGHFVNWRMIRWLRKRHRWRWGQFRRRFTTASGRWLPLSADGSSLFNPSIGDGHPIPLPGRTIPNPYLHRNHPDGSDRGEPGAWRRARRVRRAAWGNGPAAMPTPRPRPTQPAHGPSCLAGPGGVQASGDEVEAFHCGLLGREVPAGPDRPPVTGVQATRSRSSSR